MGNTVSAFASATIGVDSVEEGFFADRVDQIELRVVNANDHDLHLDAIAMSYGVVARHDRYVMPSIVLERVCSIYRVTRLDGYTVPLT